MLKTKVWVWTLGLLFTEIFVMFVLRDLVSPLAPSTRRLLEIFLPGFKWLTPAALGVGMAESFLWGVYAAMVLVPAMNIFLLKHREEHYLHPGHDRQGHRSAA